MKLLIIDQSECGLALALRAAEYNHIVYWYVEDKPETNQDSGIGIHKNIIKIKNWLPYATKVDLIVSTDNSNFIPKLDSLRKKGINVFAPTEQLVNLEIKREDGLKFLKDHGVKVPEYKTFKNFKQAEKYITENPKPYVFKTLGDNENKALTFVGKTPEQLIQRMREWTTTGVKITGDIMLQEFIKGTEIAVSRWIGRDGPIGDICESFEHKKLFVGEKGPNTGEMGTVSKYVSESKLYDLVLKPLIDDLVKMGSYTCVDINCIVDEDGHPWPLEFTSRFGWPAFNLFLLAHKGDPVKWMLDACKGKDTLKATNDVVIGVVLVLSPFPYNDNTINTKNIPIYGLTDQLKKFIQPQSIMMGKFINKVNGKFEEVEDWVSTGDYLCVITNIGSTVEEARKNVYSIIDKLAISDLGYRIDIGVKVIEALPKLQKLGYATDWEVISER